MLGYQSEPDSSSVTTPILAAPDYVDIRRWSGGRDGVCIEVSGYECLRKRKVEVPRLPRRY